MSVGNVVFRLGEPSEDVAVGLVADRNCDTHGVPSPWLPVEGGEPTVEVISRLPATDEYQYRR
jgi:hypothetical protein